MREGGAPWGVSTVWKRLAASWGHFKDNSTTIGLVELCFGTMPGNDDVVAWTPLEGPHALDADGRALVCLVLDEFHGGRLVTIDAVVADAGEEPEEREEGAWRIVR